MATDEEETKSELLKNNGSTLTGAVNTMLRGASSTSVGDRSRTVVSLSGDLT